MNVGSAKPRNALLPFGARRAPSISDDKTSDTEKSCNVPLSGRDRLAAGKTPMLALVIDDLGYNTER